MKSSSSVARWLPILGSSQLAVIAAIAGCLHSAAYAQEVQATGQETGVGDIVVTAQRRAERLSRVPISVQAVTGDQLNRAAIVDTRMLETISPSATFTGGFSGASSSVSLRGVSSASYEGGIQPSTALVVDGIPVTRPNEFLLDFADVERIEILSGPQGTLFGKNATAGVVNVVTKRPKDIFEGSVEALATTDEEYSLKGVINAPLGEGMAARINGYFRDQKPLVKNIGSGKDTYGARSYGASGRLLFNLSPDATLLLSAGYSHLYSSYGGLLILIPISGAGTPNTLGDLQTQVLGAPFGRGKLRVNQDADTYQITRNWNVGAELNWDVSDQVNLVSVTSYRDSQDRASDDDADGTPIGLRKGVGFTPNPLNYPLMWVPYGDDHIRDGLKYASQELRLNYKASRFDVIAGVFLQTFRENRRGRQGLVLAASYAGISGVPANTQFLNDTLISARVKDDTAAVFGDVTFHVTPTINLFGGLRYSYESLNVDYHRSAYFNPVAGFFDPVTFINTAAPIATLDYSLGRSDRNLSGRAGVQFQPTSAQNYYFSYNRGYKGAAADISNAASGVGSLLSPEIGSAFELGMKQRLLGGRLSLDIALYHQKINNIQQTSVAPNSILTNLINAGQLRSDGVEINIAAAPIDGLKLTLGGAYTNARYKGGRYPCNPVDLATGSPRCDASGIKSLTGEQAYGSPKYKIISAVDYDIDIAGPLTITTRAAYNWQSSIQYQLGDDPLTREPKHGILNLGLGVRADDGRFEASIFVNNVTNKFYYNYLNHADFFIGRSFGGIARDSRRYAGLRVKYQL